MRTAMFGAVGGTFVTLLARTLSPAAPPLSVPASVAPSFDPGTLFPDVERLRERLRSPVEPAAPSRNLFAFAPDSVAAPSSASGAMPPDSEPHTSAQWSGTLPPRQTPPFQVIGLAETGVDGSEWTAIISGALGPQLVKAGEVVDGWRVTAVRADGVELAPLADAAVAPVVLTLE